MQQAAATRVLRLQSFATTQAAALQQLSASHLTRLKVRTRVGRFARMQEVAVLSGLCSLELNSAQPLEFQGVSFSGLRQLTQLSIGQITVQQLSCLEPLLPQLQQLHVAVQLQNGCSAGELLAVADWLTHHGTAVDSLALGYAANIPVNRSEEETGAKAVVAALQTAASAAPGQLAAEPAPAAAVGTAPSAHAVGAQPAVRLQLQSLHAPCRAYDSVAAPLLQAMPASSLTGLKIRINWHSSEQVSALCRLTGLQRCVLQPTKATGTQAAGSLAELSSLQQLS